MDDIKNQTPIFKLPSCCIITKNNTTCWDYKVNSTEDLENYISMPENNLTIAELFPTDFTKKIKNDVFFGVSVDIPAVTINNETVNITIETEPVLPSEFLERNKSFREEDGYINDLNAKIFDELAAT
jgi:hypothetical protein